MAAAEPPHALADIFLPDSGSAKTRGHRLAVADRARLDQVIRMKPRIAIGDIEKEIGNAIAGALATPIIDIFLGAWSRLQDVAQHADPKRHAPNETHLVPLARHAINSRHEPKVELLVDGIPALTIPLEVKLTAELEGAVLTIRAGSIHAIRAADFLATGTMSCNGLVLTSLKSKRFSLPGQIAIQPPFAIGSVVVGALAQLQTRKPAEGVKLTLSGTVNGGIPWRCELSPRTSDGETVWSLGRQSGSASVIVPDASVSREQARIRYQTARGFEVCDLSSAGGMHVDGRRIGGGYESLSGVRRLRLGDCELTIEG